MKKRKVAAVIVAFLLVISLIPDIVPKASAGVETVMPELLESLSEEELRQLYSAVESFMKIGELENKIEAGGMTPASLSKAQEILAMLKSAMAATGLSAVSAATYATFFTAAGIVVFSQDWGAYWDAVFNREDFETTYQETGVGISNWMINFTHLDEVGKALVELTGVPEAAGYAPWDWDVAELTAEGWEVIHGWVSGLFGTENGVQELPALGYMEALNMLNAEYSENLVGYILPIGTYFNDPNYGQFMYSYMGSYGYGNVDYKIAIFENKNNTGIYAKGTYIGGYKGQYNIKIGVDVYENELSHKDYPPGTQVLITNVYFDQYDNPTGVGIKLPTTKESIGLPSIPYESTIEDMANQVGTGGVRLETPKISEPEGKTDEQKFVEYMKQLNPQTMVTPESNVNPDPEPSPEPDPDEDKEQNQETDGDRIKWERFLAIAVFDKFPFSLPKDMYMLVDAIAAEPKEPRFEFQIVPSGVTARTGISAAKIVLDFSNFEGIRKLVRTGFLVLFVFGLIKVTKDYIWSGGG